MAKQATITFDRKGDGWDVASMDLEALPDDPSGDYYMGVQEAADRVAMALEQWENGEE